MEHAKFGSRKKWKAVAINQNGGALTALFRIQLEG
jgi:hypothetical protein